MKKKEGGRIRRGEDKETPVRLIENPSGADSQENGAVGPKRKPRRLSDEAYERVKEAIVFCDLVPGTEVTEAQLASRFGFGKAPIRDALSRLAHEGLVRAMPQRGYMVTPLTISDIENVFTLRLLVETAGVRMATGRIDSKSLQYLEELSAIEYRPGDRNSQRAFLNGNHNFHMTIARASGNDRLARVVEDMLDEMTRMLHLCMLVCDYNEEWKLGHSEVVTAIRQADASEAERLTRLEIESSREKVLTIVLASPIVRQVNLASGDMGREKMEKSSQR